MTKLRSDVTNKSKRFYWHLRYTGITLKTNCSYCTHIAFFTCHLWFSSGMITLLCTTFWITKLVSGIVGPSRPPSWRMSKAMWPWWFSVQILRTAKRDSSSPMKAANVSRHPKWITERRVGFLVEDTGHLSSFDLILQWNDSYPFHLITDCLTCIIFMLVFLFPLVDQLKPSKCSKRRSQLVARP